MFHLRSLNVECNRVITADFLARFGNKLVPRRQYPRGVMITSFVKNASVACAQHIVGAIRELPRAYGGTCLSGPFPRGRIIDFVSVLAGTTSVPLRGSMDGVKGVAPMCAACNRGGELVGAIHELPLPRRCLELVSMFWGEPWIARTVEVLFSTKSGDESSAFFNRCSALRWARREMVQVPRVTVGGAGSRSPIRRPNRRRAQHYRPSVPSRQ